MQLNPRYGTDPIIVLDGDPAAVAEPAVRQRRRLVDLVSDFTPEAWSHRSRCDGWAARDVIAHLDTTNAFWGYSIASGRKGSPSRLLATFVAVRSRVVLVASTVDWTDDELLEHFAESTEQLCDLIESLDAADWELIAESPAGHVRISEVVAHALWDSWIHERDIAAPQAAVMPVLADEAALCLRYGAGVGPGMALTLGNERPGVLGVRAHDPDVELSVRKGSRVDVVAGVAPDVGATLVGSAAALVDALAFRSPFPQPLAAGDAWLIGSLGVAFDQAEALA